jgi:hypothetical protein
VAPLAGASVGYWLVSHALSQFGQVIFFATGMGFAAMLMLMPEDLFGRPAEKLSDRGA